MRQLTLNLEEPNLSPDLASIIGILKQHRGKSTAIPMKQLAGIINRDERKTRQLQTSIRKLREMGFPIGLSTKRGENGYYWITNLEEFRATIAKFRAWGYKNLEIARIMENKLEAILKGQLEL